MDTVNEKSTYTITATFRDENSAPVTPSSAYYNLFCESTNYQITPETEIQNLDSSVDVVISKDQNVIRNRVNKNETKLFTIRWIYSGTKQHTAEFRYAVAKLRRIL